VNSPDYEEALNTLIEAGGGSDSARLDRAQHEALRLRVRRFLATKFETSLDLDDIADEAITRFLIACIDGQVDVSRNPDAYLLRIARNAALDVLRSHREDPGEVPDFDDGRPLESFASIDRVDLINWLYCRLRAARDVDARKALAAARDLAESGEVPTVRSVARKTGLSPSSTYRAVLRIRVLLESAELERG
jgi:DNA-directed RNA polymerase specialized sigma24 family protein